MSAYKTWSDQVQIANPQDLIASFRAAGLPLADASAEQDEDESDNSKIVCLAEVNQSSVSAIVACPSGLIYRFEPTEFEPAFWSFAARNYYLVTGNMTDRNHVAILAGVQIKMAKGRTLARGKSDRLSGLTLDEMVASIRALRQPEQSSLIEDALVPAVSPSLIRQHLQSVTAENTVGRTVVADVSLDEHPFF